MTKNSIKVLHDHFTEVSLCDEQACFYLPVERSVLISTFIRKKYSNDDEIAILANGSDTDKHTEEYAAYQQYRSDIKAAIAEIEADMDALNSSYKEECALRQKEMENSMNLGENS